MSSEIFGVKTEIFPKKGHLKILSANFFPVPLKLGAKSLPLHPSFSRHNDSQSLSLTIDDRSAGQEKGENGAGQEKGENGAELGWEITAAVCR